MSAMAMQKAPDNPCYFLSIPTELRVAIYEYLFSGDDDQQMWVEIWKDGGATVHSNYCSVPPYIRYACKQTYAEATDIFFQNWKISFTFTDLTLMPSFFAKIGTDNRRGLRHLCVQYYTLSETGDVKEDLDLKYWSVVVGILQSSFHDDGLMLETLELETADDRDIGVRFGASPSTDPRLVPVACTVQVMKLAQFFPRLTRLVFEEVVLLQPEDSKTDCTLDKLPILNYMRKI